MVSNNPTHYEILGVSKNASQDDVNDAYVKAVVTNNHRDNDGDPPEKCYELKEAYRAAYMLLSCPQHRELYDQRLERRREAIHPIVVSLEDLYNGTTRNIRLFTNSVICSKCKGSIGGSRKHCLQCKGENVVVEKHVKEFEVHIEKGMQGGQKIRFSQEDLNRVSGGGVVVILLQKQHPIFKRKGDDLFVDLTISATQALYGFQIGLTHLNNREIVIQSVQGGIVEHDQVKVIDDGAMPMYQRPFMKGKLYIHFKVDFKRQLLSRPSPQLTDSEEVDETTLNIEDEIRKMKTCFRREVRREG